MKLSKILATIFLTLSVAASAGCSEDVEQNSNNEGVYLTPSVDKEKSIDRRVDKIMARMSIQQKVGQMIFVGIHGTEINDNVLHALSHYYPGGIILFDRNLESEEQVQRLTSSIQRNSPSKIPLFIGIDEEGGVVSRAPEIIEPPPSQRDLGRSGDTELAKVWAIKTARRLKELGINVNFAPVLDVGYDVDNDRSNSRKYSDDPTIVASFAQSAIAGYRQENFLFTLKHFPGIGRGTVDPHYDLSDIDVSSAILDSTDVVPFRTVISSRPSEMYFVMISHHKYPSLDPEHPASVSKTIITDFLRGSLEFDGVVITDDLEMGSISKTMSFREAGVQAIQAGADIAMCCHEYEHEQEVFNGIFDAVKKGIISEERIDESVRRILRAKISANIIPEEKE